MRRIEIPIIQGRGLDDKYIEQKEFEDLYADAELETKKIASFIIYLNNSKVKGLKFKDRK